MDITTVFGTVVEGSNPPGCTKINFICPLIKALVCKDFIKNVDNSVSNVYKGHKNFLSLKTILLIICC